VNAANLPGTCGKCHPGAGTRFEIGPVHVSVKTSPTRIEYWVRLVYLFLIVSVVGFMLVHNAVDLIVKARSWPPAPRPLPTHVPERMSRALRWQHGLVMISFPVLVYTGFALTYPERWWATPLMQFESNLGLRGLLHRGAAIVLLIALCAHVSQLFIDRGLRTCLRGMWPSWNDVRYFGARLAYYAGRRKAPHSGPFSYIEKMEYWAFMWGMVLMTLTGLLLWFSDFSLRYFPKVVTDVATAIHFYEAVLATLAILVWHLYWVIFDPDVYPMDWSWWDGKPPASRVLERQEESDVPEEGSSS
jgi:formate dehydrogenase gamma subunit